MRAAGRASRSLRACVGTAWACVGAAWASRSAREGRVAVRGGRRSSAGNGVCGRRGMHCALRACVGAAGVRRCCGGSGSAREGRVVVRGREQVFGGECVVRAAGLTHFRRSGSRVRVLLYIRPPCPRREIAVMGMKDAPCEHPSPTKTSAFAAPRLHFRAVVHTSPAYPSATPTKISASRSSSYPHCVIHGKVIHIVARRPVQNVLVLAPAHAYI